MKKIISALILSLVIFCFTKFSFTDELSDCLLSKYREYANAQKRWQIESTDLIKQYYPGLSEIADIYMQDQVLHIEKNLLAVVILLKTNQDKLNSDANLNQWLNLTKEDEQKLARESTKYNELLIISSDAMKRPPHADVDNLRSAMREEIMKLPEYQQLLSAFSKHINKLDARVCDTSKE